jgi:ATPase subunit of ABC transporter with duplicated ATPase domains
MIRIDNISKQNGHQILFIEASAALHKGEKIGLVGPNGAGKTTLFRMIAGTEQPDEGQVSVDRGLTIGYFSQDVGEMSGRSAVAEVMEGAMAKCRPGSRNSTAMRSTRARARFWRAWASARR